MPYDAIPCKWFRTGKMGTSGGTADRPELSAAERSRPRNERSLLA
jgi:hypothetical protein